MPRGDNKKKKLVAGRAVPGAPGVIYRVTAGKQKRFEAYVSYRDVRYQAQTWNSLEEAKEAQRKKLEELRAGTPQVRVAERHMLFATFVETLFFPESYGRIRRGARKGEAKRRSTIDAARSRYNVYLKPAFGKLAVVDVTYPKIVAFVTKMEKGKFRAAENVIRDVNGTSRTFCPRRAATPSTKTRREVMLLLRSVLRDAERRKIMPKTDFPDDVIPAAPRKKMKGPPPETAVQIVAAIESPVARTLSALLLMGGLRLGEAIALRWADIIDDAIFIRRTADAKTREIRDGGKTERATRTVPLDANLKPVLAAYRALQTAKKVPVYEDWLFPARRNRTPDRPVLDQASYRRRHFAPAVRTVLLKLVATGVMNADDMEKLAVTPHKLRHTYASRMVQEYPVANVSDWLGHFDAGFTMSVYVTPLPTAKRPQETSAFPSLEVPPVQSGAAAGSPQDAPAKAARKPRFSR
jgi:integrase